MKLTVQPSLRIESPWTGLPSSKRKQLERTFLQFFNVCVNARCTRNESDLCTCQGCSEEKWAYQQLKAFYLQNTTSDHQPSFFEAMKWAAQQDDDQLDAAWRCPPSAAGA